MFGSNDSVFEKFVNQFVDVDSYRQNLKEVIKIILGLDPNYKVVLITPPPICDKKFIVQWWGPEINRSYDYVKKYAGVVRNLAQELKDRINFIDLWDDKVATWNMTDCSDYADGLHLSPSGHIKYANILKTYFDANLDMFNNTLNNFVFPNVSDIYNYNK